MTGAILAAVAVGIVNARSRSSPPRVCNDGLADQEAEASRPQPPSTEYLCASAEHLASLVTVTTAEAYEAVQLALELSRRIRALSRDIESVAG